MSICDASVETLIMMNADGKILHIVEGDLESVECSPDMINGATDTILMHNHPIDRVTFSLQDLTTLAGLDCAAGIVVTTSALFFLNRPKGGWPVPDIVDLDLTLLRAMDKRDANDPHCRNDIITSAAEHWEARYWYVENWQSVGGTD